MRSPYRGSAIQRRRFLQTGAVTAGLLLHRPRLFASQSPNERPRLGLVGCGSRWGWLLANGRPYGVGPEFAKLGDYVAVCDVDSVRVDAAKKLVEQWNGHVPDGYADYRRVLERDDIDIVLVFTPDHWHVKVAVEAMLAGKDVYSEKPLTLTIGEGKLITNTVRKTNRILQVGTQQRSDRKFVTAVAMAHTGRLGTLKRLTCGIGGAPTSPEIPAVDPPATLDWNTWLGPTPEVPYRYLAGARNETGAWSNNHYEFRWWYQFSGGKLTDWGAHHVDIATWVMGKTDTGPILVEPLEVEHPVPFKDGYPTVPDRYNTATRFKIRVLYEDDTELFIESHQRNGVLIEGTNGRIFVNRGSLQGEPVDALADDPLPESAFRRAYKDRELLDENVTSASTAHVRSFFEAVRERKEPISDVFSHHRALTTCHLAGIAARLNRAIRWDPVAETIVGDDQAASFLDREKRKQFDIDMG